MLGTIGHGANGCARGNDVSDPRQVSQSMSRALQSGKLSAVCGQGLRPELCSLGFGSCCSSDDTHLLRWNFPSEIAVANEPDLAESFAALS